MLASLSLSDNICSYDGDEVEKVLSVINYPAKSSRIVD